jgi:hypothetical protein
MSPLPKSSLVLKKGFVLNLLGALKNNFVSSFVDDIEQLTVKETSFLKEFESSILKLDAAVIKEIPKEAFLAKSDGSRYLYLLAREVEWAYKQLERDLKNKKITPEDLVSKELSWKGINDLIEEFEKELTEKIQTLRASK